MRWIVPDEVFEIGRQKLIADPTLNRDRWCSAVLNDENVKGIIEQVRSRKGTLKWPTLIERLKKRGFNGFDAFKKATLGKSYVRRLNHKVLRIERLIVEPEDVYCMTVVGPRGEDDRHNFAVQSIDANGSIAPGGIFVDNSIDEDFFLPVRGQETGTRIEPLAGGQNTAAVEDVAYLRDKLFTAIKIPKAYLGYTDGAGSKASLAQLDIRFSRTIQSIQKVVVSELNKIAIVHLYALGYTGDELLNFTLNLSNPSTVATQQKLELWRARLEIAATAAENPAASRRFIRQEIWGLNEDECRQIDNDRYDEKVIDLALEDVSVPGGASSSGGGGEGDEEGLPDLANAAPPEEGGGGEEKPEKEPEAPETAGVSRDDDVIVSSVDHDEPSIDELRDKLDTDALPSKIAKHIDQVMYNRQRRRHHGAERLVEPDFVRATGNDNPSMDDPYDRTWMKSVTTNPLADGVDMRLFRRRMPADVARMLVRFDERMGRQQDPTQGDRLLSEGARGSTGVSNGDDEPLIEIEEEIG
jgi:hypothetical protein